MRPKLRFVVLEPDGERWQRIREALSLVCPNVVSVPDCEALCRMMDQCDIDRVLIGTSGTDSGHRAVAARLAFVPTQIFVVTDRRSPRRVAEYLRLGSRVHLVGPEPGDIRDALIGLLQVDEHELAASVEDLRRNRLRGGTDELPAV